MPILPRGMAPSEIEGFRLRVIDAINPKAQTGNGFL